MAAPGALVGYALLGTSRTLIVSATTATSALSAAAVGPLADGDPLRLRGALGRARPARRGRCSSLGGLLGLGAVSDFVSKPVMTGFLFGLGLVVMEAQLDALDWATTRPPSGVGVTLHRRPARVQVRCGPGWPAMSLVVAGRSSSRGRSSLSRPRRRRRGGDPARAAGPGVAGRQRRRLRRAAADGVRGADPLHRGGRRRRARSPRSTTTRSTRAATWRRWARRTCWPGCSSGLRAVRRREPDGRGGERAAGARSSPRWSPRADPAHRRVPRPAVHRPAGDGAGGDRDRRGLELPQRAPSCGALRGAAPERDRAGGCIAGRAVVGARRARRPDRDRGDLAGDRDQAAEPPAR